MEPSSAAFGESERPRQQLAIVLIGLFTVSCTITVLSNSLDPLARDLDSSRSFLLWSITGPMLAFGLVGPTLGKLGDLYGHRRLFVIGLVGAGVFAALTAVAPTAATMVAARTLSATCGSATSPAAVAYLNLLFPGAARVKALGWWSFTTAGAPVIGVLAGAPAVEAVGWRVIFAVQAPLCLIGAVIAARRLVETPRRRVASLDLAGALCLGVAALGVLTAVNRSVEWGWTNPRLIAVITVAASAAVMLPRVERRAAEPLIPFAQIRRAAVALPIAGQSLANFAYMGSFMLTPALLQNVLGYNQTRSGFTLVVRPIALAVAAACASGVVARYGTRATPTAGVGMVLISMVLFATVTSSSGIWPVAVALALAGVGVGLSSPPFAARVSASVEPADLGVVGALQQLANQLGAVLGAEVMQTVQQSGSGGYPAAFLAAGAVAAVAMGVSASMTSEVYEWAEETRRG